jgi:hypothetical protein
VWGLTSDSACPWIIYLQVVILLFGFSFEAAATHSCHGIATYSDVYMNDQVMLDPHYNPLCKTRTAIKFVYANT